MRPAPGRRTGPPQAPAPGGRRERQEPKRRGRGRRSRERRGAWCSVSRSAADLLYAAGMPVVVTGAGGIAGRAVLRRLVPRGGELRALVGRISEVPAVREIVPKTAAPDLEDTDEVALMLHDTHTVVHLHPEPD